MICNGDFLHNLLINISSIVPSLPILLIFIHWKSRVTNQNNSVLQVVHNHGLLAINKDKRYMMNLLPICKIYLYTFCLLYQGKIILFLLFLERTGSQTRTKCPFTGCTNSLIMHKSYQWITMQCINIFLIISIHSCS